jgi:hypothetical protein
MLIVRQCSARGRTDSSDGLCEHTFVWDRGDLRYAVTLAEELRIERGKPIDLETAARFLPLIAEASPSEFDAWSR